MSEPAEIKTVGNPWPGKDVAILKVNMPDKLICLTLGDSDNIVPDTQIHAMGFPGAAVLQDGSMTEEANYRVITHEGRSTSVCRSRAAGTAGKAST